MLQNARFNSYSSFDQHTANERSPEQIQERAPYLLLAFPRSGSNWVSKELEHRGTTLATEPFSLHLPPGHPLRGSGTETWEKAPPASQKAPMSPLVQRMVGPLSESHSQSMGMKEVHFGLRLGWLQQQNDAVNDVIHLVRDPVWIANSFARHDFWTTWDYEERFAQVRELIEGDESLQPFQQCLDAVQEHSWASKLALLWVVDTLLVEQLGEQGAGEITTVSYRQLAKGSEDAWTSVLEMARVEDLSVPKPKKDEGKNRAIHADPYALKCISEQFHANDDTLPQNLNDEDIRAIDVVVHAAPLHILSPERARELRRCCPFLAPLERYPGKTIPVSLQTGAQIELSQGPVRNGEFAEFLNSIGHREGEEYSLYHYYAEGCSLAFDETDKLWKVEPGKENVPITNITIEGARQFAAYYGGRLPKAEELAEVFSQLRSTSHSLGQANIANSNSGPTPVGAFGEDPLGFYDLIGNVYDYVENGTKGGARMGTSFRSKQHECDRALHISKWPELASHLAGFRVVYDNEPH